MLKNLIEVAAGRKNADLVLKNCKIVNVFTQTITEGDIAIFQDKVAGIGSYKGDKEIDINGAFVMPGLIDAHVHIESSMVVPAEYARAVAQRGVTTVIADPHEIANVRGIDGIGFMINNSSGALIDIWFAAPSCVPATHIGTNGATVGSNDIKTLLNNKKVICLGEMMNFPGVLNADSEVIKKLEYSKFTDGHAPMVSANDLNAYISAGIYTDHECVTANEAREKMSKGMYVLIREGSLAKDLSRLIDAIDSHTMHRAAFCSDDRSIADILQEGTIDHCIRKAVLLGIDPIAAVTMATLSPATCYGLKGYGAVAPGYFADLVVKKTITDTDTLYVFKKGVDILNKAKMPAESVTIPPNLTDTVILPTVTKEDIDSLCPEKYNLGIDLIPGSIITNEIEVTPTKKDGYFYNSDGKLLNIAIAADRYGKNGGMAACFICGFDIKNGAVAMSIGHDAHNISAVGSDSENIAVAINALEKKGGISVVYNKKVIEYLPLDICGIISPKSYQELFESHKNIEKALNRLEINKNISPLIALSFLSLTVIPNIRITNQGLVNSPDIIM